MTELTPSKPPTIDPSPIIGIDLGTTNSLVAHCTKAGPMILESPEGRRSLPSVVRLVPAAAGGSPPDPPDHSPPYTVAALGQAARDHAVEFPTTTLHSVKRLMGRSVADLADDLPHLPYSVVEGDHNTARIALPPELPLNPKSKIKNQKSVPTITPQEVSAILLRELKRWADAALGTAVTRAVITVPAYFDDAQRHATRDAGRLAGLEVLRIVNEPTAAALAYGLGAGGWGLGAGENTKTSTDTKSISLDTKTYPDAHASPSETQTPDPKPQTPPPSQTVAIYDLGGGTFDISILRLQQIEPASGGGGGGGSIDQVLATDGDTHLGGDDFDQALIELFQNEIRQQVDQPQLTFPPATRQAFRQLAEQIKIQLSTNDEAQIEINLQGLAPDPKPQTPDPTFSRSLTRDEFNQLITPLIDRTLAACKRALKNAKVPLNDEGFPMVDQVILVGGSTRVPLVREKVAELFGRAPYTALNPEEVVALGASVQAAILAGIHRDTLLLDVIPLSLGIETMGGAVAKLIVANTTIPARATEMFSTFAEGQTRVKIHVLQGERELVKDCRSLATFELTGIPPMPAGLPKINVTFLIDANGILSVRAVEERSGRRAQIQVVPNHGLTRAEIAQIEKDSFTHARSDMTTHRLIDLRLNARLDLRNIQKQLDRFGGNEGLRGQGAEGLNENASHSGGGSGSSVPVSDTQKTTTDDASSNQKSKIQNPKSDFVLDPAYRGQIETHMQNVQTYIDTPDDDNDADAFQKALHDLDHATLRLAELNIARTLRGDDS